MKKLYSEISIEIWKRIAYKIQRLKISEFSDDEFKNNVKQLQKLLIDDNDIMISLAAKKRVPQNSDEIGLASLLHSIYKASFSKHLAKSDFYEYIYALDDIGVKKMSFNPTGIINAISLKKSYSDSDEVYYVKKAYTDGKFKLNEFSINGDEYYDLTNLKDASYLIDVQIHRSIDKGKIDVVNSTANVMAFDFVHLPLPSKLELFNMDFPELSIEQTKLKWGESPMYKQEFEEIDMDNLSCSKRLTKTPKGVYYYKEFHK